MAASTTRWERTREPGSAFSGLSRGRGSRGRGGHRGGRTSSRTAEDNTNTSKDNPLETSRPTTVTDNPSIATTTHSNVKPPRKSLRGDPAPLQAPVAQARSSNRRRRSQVGKDPEVSPASTSQHLFVPASALIKDPPPHLRRQINVRHDIDALVERVRAVAMDNRPTTPGSHIDWAGDDDDTLPDLDDWGVNTSNFTPGESETISPIILEGLKPLPIISASVTPSPLRRAATLDTPAISDIKVNVIEGDREESTPTPSKPDAEQPAVSTVPVASKNLDTFHVTVGQPLPSKHLCSPHPSNQMSWHPSLPPKPPTGSLVPHVNLRPVATPMRHPVPPRSITSTHKEGSLPKKAQCALEQVAVESTSATSPMSVEVVSAIVKLADENVLETSNTEARAKSSASDSRPDPTDRKEIFDDDDSKAEGLEASIHAPKTPAPTESIIPPPRNHRKETINRHPPSARKPNGDYVGRFKKWNESELPFRNRSSSNAASGPPNSHHRIHTSRPIITGDAMSRLARTIGQTNSAT